MHWHTKCCKLSRSLDRNDPECACACGFLRMYMFTVYIYVNHTCIHDFLSLSAWVYIHTHTCMHDKCTCGKFYNKASCHFRPPGTSICPHPPRPLSSDPPLLLFHYELALLHSLLKQHNLITRHCATIRVSIECWRLDVDTCNSRNQKIHKCTHHMTVSTEDTSPPKSTKPRNTDTPLCRGTN